MRPGELIRSGCACWASASRNGVPEIDIKPFALHFDEHLFDLQPVISGFQECLPQLMEDLTKRCTRLELVELAPQQPDQTLARLLVAVGQRQIAENRARLSAFDPNFPSPECNGQAAQNGNGQAFARLENSAVPCKGLRERCSSTHVRSALDNQHLRIQATITN